MENLPLVGIYTLDGCTYAFAHGKFQLTNGASERTRKRAAKNQIPIDTNLNNGIVSRDPNALLSTMLESATSSVQYDPNQPSTDMAYNPASIISADSPKRLGSEGAMLGSERNLVKSKKIFFFF